MLYTEKDRREKRIVGIGLCDSCLNRIFAGDSYLVTEDEKVFCKDCQEEETQWL